MRLTRRSLLLGGGALAAATVAGQAVAKRPKVFHEATPILVEAKPISRFSVSDPDRVRFGDLAFRSGLDLRSSAKEFGGFSSLWRSVNGREIIALADNAQWLRARVETVRRTPVGIGRRGADPPDAGGRQASAQHAILRYREPCTSPERPLSWASNATMGSFALPGTAKTFSGGAPIELPFDFSNLDRNGGLESLAVAPPGSPLAGALLAVAERSPGFELRHARLYPYRFVPRRVRGGAIGWFRHLRHGISAQWRIAAAGAPVFLFGGLCHPPAARRCRRHPSGTSGRRHGVFESDASQQIDNMEGLPIHREGRDTVLTMVSDDNFNGIQRTLLLEFALAG